MPFYRSNSLVCSVHSISSQLIPRAVELSGIRGHVWSCGTLQQVVGNMCRCVPVTNALACLDVVVDDVKFSRSIRFFGLFI
jgi:hypothetical protein